MTINFIVIFLNSRTQNFAQLRLNKIEFFTTPPSAKYSPNCGNI